MAGEGAEPAGGGLDKGGGGAPWSSMAGGRRREANLATRRRGRKGRGKFHRGGWRSRATIWWIGQASARGPLCPKYGAKGVKIWGSPNIGHPLGQLLESEKQTFVPKKQLFPIIGQLLEMLLV